jgi:Nuclease-related domain
MGQHSTPDPDPYKHQDDLEELGTPVYEGSGLSVRALTAEQLQRFLDAHHGQPTQPLGSGWAALDPAGHPAGVPWAAPGAEPALPGPPVSAPAGPAEAAAGSAGRSALAQYRRRRSQERAAWIRSLVWRVPLVAAVGLTGSALATQAGLARTPATVAGLAAAALVGWRLRFRPSPQARAWQRGASGERRTARLLDRLGRDGYVVLHDLAMPGSLANIDHLVVGPSGVFVIDSKQWTGQIHQSADGLVWHNHYRLVRRSSMRV